ncbi:hypothetical protein GLOIN_2v1489476 [Rhizophagus clarus]|uniref:Uncharacterized protein n=1 Tax=Rhizophagus clarus TaxID=94130 RepID=A0A8H3QP72_9GLOM|nr:hypothetical protein GLOIN_2v1489476 [Rhizophagus clarus]
MKLFLKTYHTLMLLVSLDIDDNSDNEEVIWEDVELDEKAETFVAVLLNRMKNYVLPAQKSVYIGNSVQTKKRKRVQVKKLLAENEYFNYEQLIKFLKSEVKSSNFNSGYKLRLTALLQYLRHINHKELKIKVSFSIAWQLNKGPYFARCLREWEKLVKNGKTILISKQGKHCKIKSLLDDENIQMQITTYLRKNKFEFYVADFIDYVKNVVFPSLEIKQK